VPEHIFVTMPLPVMKCCRRHTMHQCLTTFHLSPLHTHSAFSFTSPHLFPPPPPAPTLAFPTPLHNSLASMPGPPSTPPAPHPSPNSPTTRPGRPPTTLPLAHTLPAGSTVSSRILTLSLITTMFPTLQREPILTWLPIVAALTCVYGPI
jgi:hypothetical protein